LIGLRILNVHFLRVRNSRTQGPNPLSSSSSKPCVTFALPAARLLLAKLLSSTTHRRPLTWKKYAFNKEEVPSKWSPHFRDHKFGLHAYNWNNIPHIK